MISLDLLDEVHDVAMVRLTVYQRRMAQYYNRMVKLRRFEVGDLILREIEASTPQNTRKLMPNWEGPYEIVGVPKSRMYRLQTLERVKIKNTWHSGRRRRYYQ